MLERSRLDQHSAARDKRYFTHSIVPFRIFPTTMTREPSPKAELSARVPNRGFRVGIINFWIDEDCLFLALSGLNHPCQKVRRNGCVVIQEQEVICSLLHRPPHPDVAAAGKSKILRILN